MFPNPANDAPGELTERLVRETAEGLGRARGNTEALRGAVFLYLHRAYEAGLEPDTAVSLFGVGPGTAMAAAELSPEDTEAVIQAYDEQDELVRRVHGRGDQRG